MAFEKAVQALAGIEEKLRRAFGLAGPIGAKLDPTVIPVLIADDLRDPGHAFFSGRSWWIANFDVVAPAGNNGVSILAQADVLIEAMFVTGQLAAGGNIQAFITSPSEAVPVAAGSTGAVWRDRKMVPLDQPPLLISAAWNASIAPGANQRVARWRGAPAATQYIDSVRECKVMLPAGGSLTFFSDAASSVTVGCWGRVFP